MSELLYGRNAVRESLRAGRRHFYRLLLAKGSEQSPIINEILSLARTQRVEMRQVSRKQLEQQGPGHQGVALEVGRLPTLDITDILAHAEKLGESPFFLVADHLEDPHNLGAILRTAECVGVHGVILPKQRATKITPTVVNVSAGAAEHILVAQIPNLTRVLKQLKNKNIWVAGVEGDPAAQFFQNVDLSGPLALVIGNEGKGLSRLVRETCDYLLKIPMRGQIESLNASVAAGLTLYEVWRARQFV